MESQRDTSLAGGARSRLPAEKAKRFGLLAAVAIGVPTGVLGARVAHRMWQLWLGAARFWYGAFTLRLYRRCPDCRRFIRGDARVCFRCGYRKRSPRRWAAR